MLDSHCAKPLVLEVHDRQESIVLHRVHVIPPVKIRRGLGHGHVLEVFADGSRAKLVSRVSTDT